MLSGDSDVRHPWLDPQQSITEGLVREATERLKLAPEEIKRRYEQLADRFGLKVAWRK